MQPGPPERGQAADQHLLDQRVGEPPAPGPGALDDEADGDRGVHGGQRVLGGDAGGLEEVQRDLPAGDGGELEDLPRPRRQPVEPGAQHLAHRRRDGRGVQVQVVGADHPARQLDDEERVAAGAVVDGRRQRPVAGGAQLRGQQGRDVVLTQAGQPQDGGAGLAGEAGQAVGDGLGQLLPDGAGGDHQEDRRPRQVPGQQAEQLHRGRVGALQVVEDDEHRVGAGPPPRAGRGDPGRGGNGPRRRRPHRPG